MLSSRIGFFSILICFHEILDSLGSREGDAISLLLALSVWLVSWYVFSTVKSLFTGFLWTVLVFAILTITPLISESLLVNTHVTMKIFQKCLGTFS